MANPYYACILAGGSGERFWPMSRSRKPKHLLKLLTDKTLIEETVRRLDGVVNQDNIFVLTSEIQLEAIRAALPSIPKDQIIAEPVRRDTAPAAALATALVHAKDPNAILALLPADAFIKDASTFSKQLIQGFKLAAGEGWKVHGPTLLTFGIKPSFASTGFGYMEMGAAIICDPKSGDFRHVKRFVEKPDLPTAEKYLAGGNHVWNAGIFIWKTSAFKAEADRSAIALGSFITHFPKENTAEYIAKEFPLLPRISVDYAILEKAQSVVTLISEFDWDDVGTWTALEKHLIHDASNNATKGSVVVSDASGNIAVSNGRLISLCGVKDLVVVETADSILVCHKDSVQDIKKIYAVLPKELT
ncbi:MAG: sugar phosphate nucleotidyltransferase [Verrucomicrobiota bacterium]